jgi:hypothetical protein
VNQCFVRHVFLGIGQVPKAADEDANPDKCNPFVEERRELTGNQILVRFQDGQILFFRANVKLVAV